MASTVSKVGGAGLPGSSEESEGARVLERLAEPDGAVAVGAAVGRLVAEGAVAGVRVAVGTAVGRGRRVVLEGAKDGGG